MKLHSLSDIVTNSSTQTFSMATNPERVYDLLTEVMSMLNMGGDAHDAFDVKEKVDVDEYELAEFVDELTGDDFEEETGATRADHDYWERREAYVDKLIETGAYTEEDYVHHKLDNSPYAYDSYYEVTYKATGKTFNINTLFDVGAS